MLCRRLNFVIKKCYVRRQISTTVKLCNKDSSIPQNNIANHSTDHTSHDLPQPTTTNYTDTISESSDAVVTYVPHKVDMLESAWHSFSDSIGTVVEYIVYPMKWIMGKVLPSSSSLPGTVDTVFLLDNARPKFYTFYMPWLLDHFQGLTGTPWIFVCIGSTVLIRLALFKLTRKNLWTFYNMAETSRIMKIHQDAVNYYKSTKNYRKMMSSQKKLMEHTTLSNGLLFIGLNLMLMAIPIRLTMVSLAHLKGLSVNEYGWISDLTVSDPTYILPSIIMAAMVTMGYVNVRHHKYFNERTAMFAVPVAALGIYFLGTFPAVLAQHYAISACISAFINVSRENEMLRKKLGIPPSKPPVYEGLKRIPDTKQLNVGHLPTPEDTPDEPQESPSIFKYMSKQAKWINTSRGNIKRRVQTWMFMRKLKRHGAKGIVTEYLEERPAITRLGSDSVVLVTDVTPELQKYVLRRMHDFRTLKGTEKAIVWIRRVQNKRW